MKKIRFSSSKFSIGNKSLSRFLLFFSVMVLFIASVSSVMGATIDVSPAIKITNTGDGSGNGFYEREADFLIASNNIWYIVYAKSQTTFTAGTNKDDLKYDAYVKTSTDDGVTWSAETKVLDAAAVNVDASFRGPKIVEADGKIWVIAPDITSKDIYANTMPSTSGSWSGQSMIFDGSSGNDFFHIDPVAEGDNIRLFGGIGNEALGVGFIMYDGTANTWDTSVTSTGVLAQIPDVIKVGSTYYMVGPESSPTHWDYVLFTTTTEARLNANPTDWDAPAQIATAPVSGDWSANDPTILKYGDSGGTDDLIVFWAPNDADDAQSLEYVYSTNGGDTWSSSFPFTDATHGSDVSDDFMPSAHMLDADTIQVIFNMGERGVNLGQGDIVSVDWDISSTIGNEHYTTIQDAIDAATTGDTINVAAGTYDENVVLPSTTDLTLLGAQANVDPTVDGGRAGPESVLDGWVDGSHGTGNGITLPSDAGIVVINGFTIKGYAYGVKGTESGGVAGATISYNIFDNNGNDGTADNYFDSANNVGAGILVYNMDTSTISYNVVKNGERGIRLDNVASDGSDGNTISYNLIHDNEQYGIAIYSFGDDNTIEYNTIYNSADRGIQLGWGGDQFRNVIQYNEIYDINIDGILITNAYDYIITGNTIYNVAFTDQTLGRPTGGDPDPVFSTQDVHGGIALVGTNSDVTITDNLIYDNGEMGTGNPWGVIPNAITSWATSDGIWISSSSSATVNNNKIYNNNEYGLENTNTGTTTDAENNWWGDVDPSDDVNGDVDYSPWCTNSGCTDFGPVMLIAVSDGTKTGYSTIQAAIDAATTGDTINVAAETYLENVVIDKSLTLQGADKTTTIISGTTGTVVTINADNVVIDGFTITNDNTHGTGIYSSDHSNLTITNNIVTAIGNSNEDIRGQGIVIISSSAAVGNIIITNNQINSITSGLRTGSSSTSSKGIAIGWNTGDYNITGLLIQGNVITDIDANTNPWTDSTKGQGAYGIIINHGTGITGKTVGAQILDNEISDLEGLWAHGIGLEGNTPNALVEGNTISDLTDHKSPSDAVAVQFEDNPSADTVDISQNSFSNINVGVQNVVSDKTVNAENNWWGDATGPSHSTNPNGQGNTVSDNVDYDPWCTDSDCSGTAGGAGGASSVGYSSTWASTVKVALDWLFNRAEQDTDGVSIYLHQGWNTFKLPWFVLIGSAQADSSVAIALDGNYAVTNVLSSLETNYNYLAYYNGTAWQTFVPDNVLATSFTEFPINATQEDFDFHIYMTTGARLSIPVIEEET